MPPNAVAFSGGSEFRSKDIAAREVELSGEFIDGRAIESACGPVGHACGAEALVKVDGGLVPIEHRPLQASAIFVAGDLREVEQEGFAVTVSTMLEGDEEVFEMNTFTSHESGEGVIEKREADRLIIEPSNHASCRGGAGSGEQLFAQVFGGGDRLVREFLVGRELVDEAMNLGCVGGAGWANLE